MKGQTKKQLFYEILRFLLVGVIATVVDYFVFWCLDGWLFKLIMPTHQKAWETISLALATGAGFCVGLFVNWILSAHFVFRAVQDKGKTRSKKSFWLFTLIAIIGLILTEIGVLVLVAVFPQVTLFGRTELFSTAMEKWVAKAIMTCLVLIWNYIGRKLFVFKG